MTGFVPIALACGHVVEEPATFEVGGGRPARVECPEGCGWQEFVIEPHDGEFRCLCEPGRHVCGEAETVVIDLRWIDQ